jgi:hypothetical protein
VYRSGLNQLRGYIGLICLFNDAVSSSDCIALNGRITNELERM